MTTNDLLRPDVDRVLAKLKDFQRETVAYVFKRLYLDDDRVSRFLIADEVGLGKTLVARGLIAKAVDHMWDSIDRIDVLYICSNQEIARQNIDRLNITADRKFQFASRATLLPVTLEQLRGNKLNFVSFTPATSFRLRSQSGVVKERWVLYRLLLGHWDAHEPTLRNIMRAGVMKGNFRKRIKSYDEAETIDPELASAFYLELDKHPYLFESYQELAEAIGYHRKYIPPEMRSKRDKFIGELRRLLARSSLAALEPDIVILDEFQRFKYLLEEDNPIALLAREVFDFPEVKVLLLSATPYKMYSLAWEREEDHYEDFFRTAKFLLNDDMEALGELERGVNAYRDVYLQWGFGGRDRIRSAKLAIESVLRKVMVRTERLAASEDRNGMLEERCVGQNKVRARDLDAFVQLDSIARIMDAGDQMEYWKSTAYPLNLMEDYRVKQRLKSTLEGQVSGRLSDLLRKAEPHLLKWEDIQTYREVDPENARLRALFDDTLDTGNWKLLWMPPSMPYYRPGRAFKGVSSEGYTKTLVFSAWRVVPKVIAVLASYDAERRMLIKGDRDIRYGELTRKRRPLLNFARSRGRLVGMPIFCLSYPSWTLAKELDPLRISGMLSSGKIPSPTAVFRRAREMVRKLLEDPIRDWPIEDSMQTDSRWYWAALGIMDWKNHRDLIEAWFETEEKQFRWERMLEDDTEGETRYVEHVHTFVKLLRERQPLGKQPKDLADVLTRVALAGPGICTLRSMLRILGPTSFDEDLAILAGAARAGLAFRSLFNQPDAISLINQAYRSGAYWKKVLRYAQDGNLQAALDEYMHVLNETLGLMGHDPVETALKLSETLAKALSLRSPSLVFDEIMQGPDGRYALQPRRIRCRYALRFGDEKSKGEQEWTRSADVRIAFNSPFRPFILATTSIGQEGLDFHQYCHRVVHWNLPSNPVDIEQREGRVHRFKCHVIRRNLAKKYGLPRVETMGRDLEDPWAILFGQALKDRPDDVNDLVPFWIFDLKGGYKIERRIPVLPLSRELGRLGWLKKTLVAYRSVMGQPRQEELLRFLAGRLTRKELEAFTAETAVDLSPPKSGLGT